MLEPIEKIKKLRDICDEIVKAYEKEDEELLESAMGRFLYLCMQLGGSK